MPDFVIRLTNGISLILETKGYDPLEDVKAQAAWRWVDADNAGGAHGEWRYEIVHQMGEIGVVIGLAKGCVRPARELRSMFPPCRRFERGRASGVRVRDVPRAALSEGRGTRPPPRPMLACPAEAGGSLLYLVLPAHCRLPGRV